MSFIKVSLALFVILGLFLQFSSCLEEEVVVIERELNTLPIRGDVNGQVEDEGELEVKVTVEKNNQNAEAVDLRASPVCPHVKFGANQPAFISGCLVAEEDDKKRNPSGLVCYTLEDLFTNHRAIDAYIVAATECNGVKKLNCKSVPLKYGLDYQLFPEGICFNKDADRVCKNSKTPNCVRYYKLLVTNLESQYDYTKTEGACAILQTQIVVASSKSALKGLTGHCYSSYVCGFENLELECALSGCLFAPQNFPMNLHLTNVKVELGKRVSGQDITINGEDYNDCFNQPIPRNTGVSYITNQVGNGKTCEKADFYGLWITAKICDRLVYYKTPIIIEQHPIGGFCLIDSDCRKSNDYHQIVCVRDNSGKQISGGICTKIDMD